MQNEAVRTEQEQVVCRVRQALGEYADRIREGLPPLPEDLAASLLRPCEGENPEDLHREEDLYHEEGLTSLAITLLILREEEWRFELHPRVKAALQALLDRGETIPTERGGRTGWRARPGGPGGPAVETEGGATYKRGPKSWKGQMFEELKADPNITGERLAEKCGCSRSTLYHDGDFLRIRAALTLKTGDISGGHWVADKDGGRGQLEAEAEDDRR